MLPLKDKTVLITRSANQADDFTNQLKDLGATTIALPLVKNTAINQNILVHQFEQNNYDWIIFTSTNAVRFFFEKVPPKLITSKIAVVGSKTKKMIEEFGLTIDFMPSEFTGKQLANELPINSNQQILIPRSNLAKNDSVEILENKNCNVETISIYENTPIRYSKEELNKVFNQKIDFITFTSGSTVTVFQQLGFPLTQEKVICIGPETAKIAEQNNIKITSIASPHTTEGMLEAILKN